MTQETNTNVETFDKALFIQQYHATGKPSQKKIPCTVTGNMVTCFGANLQLKIKKYGSVEALLEGFVSRGAKKATVSPGSAVRLISWRPTRFSVPTGVQHNRERA